MAQGRKILNSDDLIEAYYAFAVEGDAPVAFVDRVLHGDYGAPNREALLQFLDQIESIILGNIETRLDETPHITVDVEAVRDEARAAIDAARARVFHAWPKNP